MREHARGSMILLATLMAAAVVPAASAAPSDVPLTLAAPASSGPRARADVAALRRATAVNDRDGNKVFDDLDRAFASTTADRLPVVVSFVEGVTTRKGLEAVREVTPNIVVVRAFDIIPAYAGALSRAEVLRIARLSQVRQIELDRAGTPELDTATEIMGADAVVDEMGITGSLDGDPDTATAADVGIAVLDTGFDTGHTDLDGKVIAWRDFGTNREDPYDPGGHGTHVASIAAGWGRSSETLRGVAPGASIIGIKIDGGGNTTSNAIAGYEWIVERRAELGIRVATISFGFGTATDGTTALERAVDAAWDAGIVCFKSNGNSGPGASSMTVPAAARGILSIGSLLDPFGTGGSSKYGFTLSEYSSRGPTSDGRIKPDLVAPGESIRAADAGTASGSVVASGTSMASPFAAGTAALMIAADPSLGPDDVRELLYSTAEQRGAPGPDNDFGHGRIQVREAVGAALAGAGKEEPPSSPPLAPTQQTLTGTAGNGVFEGQIVVTDARFPLAIVALAPLAVAGLLVTDPSGEAVPGPAAIPNAGDRQHHVTFHPPVTGTYLVRVLTVPGSDVVLDVSHSVNA